MKAMSQNSLNNLIPVNRLPKSEALILQKRGGRAKTPLRNEAAKWREFRKRAERQGLTEKDVDMIIEKVNNRDVQAFEMLTKAELFYKDIHPAQRVALLNAELGIAKFIHGEKVKVENTNINLNMNRDLTDEETQNILEFLGKHKGGQK